MKIFNFNCRIDVQQDGEHQFPHRLGAIHQLIKDTDASILTFQELFPHMQTAIAEVLPDRYVWLGRSRSGDWQDEFPAIVFDASRYFLRDYRQMWLSYTPELPGSRYPIQSSCPRTYGLALLEERVSGSRLLIGTTHLDHESEQARLLGMTQVMGEIVSFVDRTAIPGLPVIFTGDFNADPSEDCIKLATTMPLDETSDNTLRDLTAKLGPTFHDFDRAFQPVKIDYVLASKSVRLIKAEHYDKDSMGTYYSDHVAQVVEVQIP